MIQGSDHELEFWKGFVKTDRFLKGWVANIQTPELDPYIADFIRANCQGKILDCGSGVVSILHGLGFDVTATDLLGDEYAKIFDYSKASIEPVVSVATEDLPYENEFDIVMMRNALDHTQDPGKAYKALLKAVKPGGYLIVSGFENEADAENWQGMHQWNIAIKYGALVISDKTEERFVFNGDTLCHKSEELPNGKTWFTWIVKR